MDPDFLLKRYGELYGPEAGPWNLSVESKYLEYRITAFFEENFTVGEGADICNVGIGAGYWDRYLSYQLQGGSLTSIDLDGNICRGLSECLKNEGNPSPVKIIHKDVMECTELCGKFDIVTMVGSTRLESGLFESILERLFSLLKPGGCLYYQSIAQDEDAEAVKTLCRRNGLQVENYLQEKPFGRPYHYWKIATGSCM